MRVSVRWYVCGTVDRLDWCQGTRGSGGTERGRTTPRAKRERSRFNVGQKDKASLVRALLTRRPSGPFQIHTHTHKITYARPPRTHVLYIQTGNALVERDHPITSIVIIFFLLALIRFLPTFPATFIFDVYPD
jgi:hypothetical protein